MTATPAEHRARAETLAAIVGQPDTAQRAAAFAQLPVALRGLDWSEMVSLAQLHALLAALPADVETRL